MNFKDLSKKIVLAGVLGGSLFFQSTLANAENFSGGFRTGRLTYGVGGGSSSIASTAASQWNGVSSKVSLSSTSASSANIVTYFDTTNAPTAGALGITYPYKNNSGATASPNETWTKAVVYQYRSNYLNTTAKKTGTATHELGHALSVAHPNNSNVDAVMKQGVKTSYNLKAYDRNSLINKWGR